MWQQGQVFKLKAKGSDGQPLWAYRHRLEGRGSVRPQVGGFATRTEALKALEKALARGVPNQLRRSKEKRPFESWRHIDAIAERLSPVRGRDRASPLGVVCGRTTRHRP